MRLTSENVPEGWGGQIRRALVPGFLWGPVVFLIGAGVWSLAVRGSGWAFIAIGLGFVPIVLLIHSLHSIRRDRRVIVDFDRREVMFENHEIMRGFWARKPRERYVVGFDDVRGVEWLRGRTSLLVVHLPEGRVRINEHSTNFPELCAALKTIAAGRRVAVMRRQITPILIAVGVVIGGVMLALAMGWLP